jgi:hypothetical protein
MIVKRACAEKRILGIAITSFLRETFQIALARDEIALAARAMPLHAAMAMKRF